MSPRVERRLAGPPASPRATRAVGIDRVGARFLSFGREIGLACRPKAVAPVITLCKVALAVESLDTRDNLWWPVRKAWWSVRGNSEGVFARKRRVRAPFIVLRPRRAGRRRQSNCRRHHSCREPALHLRPLPFGLKDGIGLFCRGTGL